MGARIEYACGDVLNKETGTLFLEEIPVNKGSLRKARCKCGYCGNEDFVISIKNAKRGQLCNLCKSERLSKQQFIKYNIGQVLNEKTGSVYLGEAGFNSAHQRMGKIKCGYCGKEYSAVIANVKNGALCPLCRSERANKKISESSKQFYVGDIIENPYGIKYIILDEVYENGHRKCIFAPLDKENKPIEEKSFKSWIHQVLYGLTSGKTKISSIELAISNYLSSRDIPFVFQKTFDDLLSDSGYHMYFDFSILLKNNQILLIEADGEQHFAPVSTFGGEEAFKKQKIRDQLKTDYVDKRSNLFLERIPYYNFRNINTILEDILLYYSVIEEEV